MGYHLKREQSTDWSWGFGIVDNLRRNADLGYSFNPKYWNKGYVKEMTTAVINYGFLKKNLIRIQGC